MPVKPEFNPDYLYFVTTTASKHMHLFREDSVKRIILDSFHFLRTSGRMHLYAFVIMPNHVHFISRFGADHPLPAVLRDFKRHTARQVILQLRVQQPEMIASIYAANRSPEQEYKIWEDGYDAREVFTLAFMEQKLNYLHNNPCQEHWKLVELPEEYPWSSARYYLKGEPSIIPVDDVRELF